MPASRKASARGGVRICAGQEGLALVTTLLVMALLGGLIAATLLTGINATRTTSAEYQNSRAFYAAEAGVEAALAQVKLALQDGFLADDELAGIVPPTIDGFDFIEYSVVKSGTVDTVTITDGPFAGLYAITQDITITSRATAGLDAHAGVVVGAKAQAIPLFQFAGFAEGGMEAYSGGRVDSYGRRHVNGDIYMATSDTHFHDYLSTPGKFILDGRVSHEDRSDINFYMENASGVDVLVTFDSEDTPDPDQFKLKSETDLDGRLRTGAFGVDSLKLPLPDGVPPLELIKPKDATDNEVERATKFAWQADMYVEVDLGDVKPRTTVCGSHTGGPTQWPNITVTRAVGAALPSAEDKCRIFPFKWEAFYDWREQKWIDIAGVDLGELRTWVMADSAGRAPRIIYVEIKESGVSVSGTTDKSGEGFYFPSLRLQNGARLHGPLTIGSEFPFYIQGDYNNINKQPAAVFGDYMIALSNQWVDAVSPAKNPVKSPTVTGPVEMFVSVITGESEGYLGCYHEGPDPGCIPIPAGWGLTGTVNHLENWKGCGGSKCLFRLIGSFVTFWYPQRAIAMGPPLGYYHYSSPNRDWSFDFDLMDPSKLPPGTPSVGYVLRASFREVLF